MPRPFTFARVASVRARTTLFATAVVAVALVVTGLAVVLLLRANLDRQSDLQAEVSAREVASQLAAGVPYAQLDVPDGDENPVQVVDSSGRVVAAGEDLSAISGTGPAAVKPAASPGPPDDDDDRDEDTPQRGEVSGDVHHSTGSATVDGETADYRFASIAVTTPGGETLTVHAGTAVATARKAVGTVTQAMLAGLPVLLAVVAGVTWLVTRRALRPVAAIRTELAEITASSDLTRRVPVPASRDEVAALATATNETLAALERSVERQRGFVADASHELRNPIASLRTELEVAAAHPELLDLDGLTTEVVRLQHLAADLLLLARLDAGEQAVTPKPVALADLLREEVERRGPADRVPIGIELKAAPQVLGSRDRLARALANLLNNAQRHASSQVNVTLRQDGDRWVVMDITDDGPGVPPGDRERIFERFVRLDDARSRDEGGAGLGLAIARDLLRAHGGTLTVEAAPGGGALFRMRLPLRNARTEGHGRA
ncbi:sensor histidine kinase [Actinomadura rudentiformis]|uniref:histidine kinase n=1 Tax=Actinomadura rudentiformis TaxID=359158 RepID=A0A6H9YL39_9ACTN|nr:HAMP domain-containing sensor histidine kinase [Actinomadura rudentiformis]KAB2347928.1 HAMP domain-containing histidine kinase [Actinomadura rudentiformis]